MKLCVLCRNEFPLNEFNRRKRSRDGLQNVCRECNRRQARDYYRRNRIAHRQVVRTRTESGRAENVRSLTAYLLLHPCVDCGEDDVRVLEFDHRPGAGKTANVSYLARNAYPWDRIEEEIAKCDVRCRNCHAKVTYERSGQNWRTQAMDDLRQEIDAFTLAVLLDSPAPTSASRE